MPRLQRCNNSDGTLHGYMFFCPGCDRPHMVDLKWECNGDPDKPTIRPSILVHAHPDIPEPQPQCHSFVTDGRIQFLADSTHALAGQTVDLPDIDTEMNRPVTNCVDCSKIDTCVIRKHSTSVTGCSNNRIEEDSINK